MRAILLAVVWVLCSGFTMNFEWTMPEDSNHDYFVVEYCRTSVNAKNCLRSAAGWKEHQIVAGDLRLLSITEDAAGQHCYRVKAGNDAGRSGPSNVKCGFN